ncbi:MAG: metal-sulfur cluster assembly factor [Anaerolineales bacterium]|nr:metal-sulfur cluster assembly factor [Anaerolineales bacterium]
MSQNLTIDECWTALRNVIDPELYQNIVDLGLIYGVEVVPENQVKVTMTLTTPHCPMGPQILESVDLFLRKAGASHVDIEIVWTPPWTPMMMTDDLKRMLGVIEEEEDLDLEPEPAWTPPPKKKKGVLGWLFK